MIPPLVQVQSAVKYVAAQPRVCWHRLPPLSGLIITCFRPQRPQRHNVFSAGEIFQMQCAQAKYISPTNWWWKYYDGENLDWWLVRCIEIAGILLEFIRFGTLLKIYTILIRMMMLMMKVFLWVKHRPLSVSFLIRISGKDPHSQAGSGRYNIYWKLSDTVEEHFLRECFF